MYFDSFEFQNPAHFPAQRLRPAPGCKIPTSWVRAKVGLHRAGAQRILPGRPSRRAHRTSHRHPVCQITTRSNRASITINTSTEPLISPVASSQRFKMRSSLFLQCHLIH